MSRTQFLEHRGVRILSVDYSGIATAEELLEAVHAASGIIRSHPPQSLLILVDLAGVPYTLQKVAILRRATIVNSPYVKARAVIGLPRIAELSFEAVAQVAKTRMRSFADRSAALDWLAEQA